MVFDHDSATPPAVLRRGFSYLHNFSHELTTLFTSLEHGRDGPRGHQRGKRRVRTKTHKQLSRSFLPLLHGLTYLGQEEHGPQDGFLVDAIPGRSQRRSRASATADHAVRILVSSKSGALIALCWMEMSWGDTVYLPTLLYVASANIFPLDYAGLPQ